MTVYFAGFKFNETYGASAALNKVRAAAELHYTWVDDVAIIERHNSGRISTHTPHGSTTRGAGWGALLSGLVGIWFPPGGFLTIAGLSAGTGALIEKAVKEYNIPSDLFDEVKADLEKGTSALLVIGESTMLGEAEAAFAGYATLYKRELADETAKKMRDMVDEQDEDVDA